MDLKMVKTVNFMVLLSYRDLENYFLLTMMDK